MLDQCVFLRYLVNDSGRYFRRIEVAHDRSRLNRFLHGSDLEELVQYLLFLDTGQVGGSVIVLDDLRGSSMEG